MLGSLVRDIGFAEHKWRRSIFQKAVPSASNCTVDHEYWWVLPAIQMQCRMSVTTAPTYWGRWFNWRLSLPSARQHPSYGDWLRRNIIRTALCWIVWHNVHSPQHTYVSSSYRSNRLGLSHWDPYTVHRGSCLELYYCNMVEWFWWDSSLILTTNWFPSVF